MTEIYAESAAGNWSVPQCPFAIDYSLRVLDDIRLAVMDAFFSLPRGGAEIGGVLIGKFADGRLVISDYLALDCEHAMGPSFTLSQNDEAKLEELLAEVRKGGAGEPVGWYHSHTRSEIFLSDADLMVHRRFFPEPWQIALVMKPHTFEPMRCGFFFREADGSVQAAATYQEFALDPLAVRPIPSGDIPQPVDTAFPSMNRDDRNGSAILLEATAVSSISVPVDPAPEPPLVARQPEPQPVVQVTEPAPATPVTEPAPVASAPEPTPTAPVQEQTPAAQVTGPAPAASVPEQTPVATVTEPAATAQVPEPPSVAQVPEPTPLVPVTEPAATAQVPEPPVPPAPMPPVARKPDPPPVLQEPVPSVARKPEPPTVHQPPSEKPRVVEPPSFLAEPVKAKSKAGLKVVVGLAMAAVLAFAGYQTRHQWSAKLAGLSTSSTPAPPAFASLGLVTVDNDGQLQIRWDRFAPAVRQATGGRLTISDTGASPREIKLDAALLQAGNFTYARQGDSVSVILALNEPDGREAHEAAAFVGKAPPPKTPAVAANPEIRKQRDAALEETARLQKELSAQQDRSQKAVDESARLRKELAVQLDRGKKLQKELDDARAQIREQQRKRLATQIPK